MTLSDTDYDRHLQPANTAINQLADDVEMRAPDTESGTYVVADTNILLHHYEALRTFTEDVVKSGVPVVVVVPGVVVYEIDKQKNRANLAWPARRASGWLLASLREQKCVKVQATEETCKPSGNWRSLKDVRNLAIPNEMMNDHLILDCCQFFQKTHPRTILCSADQNLCVIAQSQGIPSMTPSRSKPWTSRDIATVLFGEEFVLLSRFGVENSALKRGGKEDDDIMMVDEEEPVKETPLNVLHDDVRVYFTRLLIETALEVGGDELRKPIDASGLSRHAASWKRKHYSSWTASDCLEYLYYARPELKKEIETGYPRLEAFLEERYTAPGARTGPEWPAESWRQALRKLAIVGRSLKSDGIVEGVRDLVPYLDVVLPINL